MPLTDSIHSRLCSDIQITADEKKLPRGTNVVLVTPAVAGLHGRWFAPRLAIRLPLNAPSIHALPAIPASEDRSGGSAGFHCDGAGKFGRTTTSGDPIDERGCHTVSFAI